MEVDGAQCMLEILDTAGTVSQLLRSVTILMAVIVSYLLSLGFLL